MKGVVLIVGVCIIILLLSAVLAGIVAFRSSSYTDTFNTATVAGVTSANITLSQDLLDGATYNAKITSSNTNDAPNPNAYNSDTKILNIVGLEASATRLLTVKYNYGSLAAYIPGADIMARIWPVTLGLAIFGLVGAGIYQAWKEAAGGA